jgi:hypothetical protein
LELKDELEPLVYINLRAMELIWSSVDKETKDGVEYVTYVKGDIPFLYYSGLVDTERFTLQQWEDAFKDCLGEDGRYWVSHEKMLWLGRFRYCRTVGEPFDPLNMRTGQYSVDRLWKLFENSIIPSCSLPKEFLKNTFDQMFRKKKSVTEIFSKELKEAKEQGEELDESQLTPVHLTTAGKETFVEITREHLLNLKHFLDNYPSPRRKMEVAVYQMRMDKLQELANIAKQPQKSSFEAGEDFRDKTKKSLKDMLVKASESATAGRKPMDEVIDIGKMQKKKRPPTKF